MSIRVNILIFCLLKFMKCLKTHPSFVFCLERLCFEFYTVMGGDYNLSSSEILRLRQARGGFHGGVPEADFQLPAAAAATIPAPEDEGLRGR